MSFRQKISTFKKDIKDRFKGSKRNRDKKGPGTSGESAGLEESRSRSESPFVGGGGRDLEGSGSNPVGGHIGSTDRPAEREESEPVPAVETKTGPEGKERGTLMKTKPARLSLRIHSQMSKLWLKVDAAKGLNESHLTLRSRRAQNPVVCKLCSSRCGL